VFVLGLADWNVPTGGMFLWLKAIGIADTFGLISEKALAKQVRLSQSSMHTRWLFR
jgi:kynurenine/2-aminoadipate aminotransferase